MRSGGLVTILFWLVALVIAGGVLQHALTRTEIISPGLITLVVLEIFLIVGDEYRTFKISKDRLEVTRESSRSGETKKQKPNTDQSKQS
jgi:hypothetical protein